MSINNSNVGMAAYQKKSEFGPGKIELNNTVLNDLNKEFLVEDYSSLILNQKRKGANIKNAYEFLYKDF